MRAGHGTIGLEILEELPDADAVVIPYGGGGLSCGIAPGLRALSLIPSCTPVKLRQGHPWPLRSQPESLLRSIIHPAL